MYNASHVIVVKGRKKVLEIKRIKLRVLPTKKKEREMSFNLSSPDVTVKR